MRRKFLVGIIAENGAIPAPPEVVDFISDWGQKGKKPILLSIAYCPFCGMGLGDEGVRRDPRQMRGGE